MMQVGWWGVPGSNREGTQVHISVSAHKALCGDTFVPHSEFQWCTHDVAFGLYIVECGRCREKFERTTEAKRNERRAPQVIVVERQARPHGVMGFYNEELDDRP